MQCTVQAAEGQDCDCNLSSTPVDDSASLPEKQKEIVQQNDVKFIATETGYHFALFINITTYKSYQLSCYNFIYSSSVFHPPGIAIS